MDMDKKKRIDEIDDQSYIKEYYRHNYGGKTQSRMIDNRTDTVCDPYHGNEYANKWMSKLNSAKVSGYLGKGDVDPKGYQRAQYIGQKHIVADNMQGQMLKEKKRQYQKFDWTSISKVARKATETEWSDEEEEYTKKLSPEKARQVNSSYVQKDKKFSIKDKFNRELKRSTVEAVKRFDLDKDHNQRSKAHKKSMVPYQRHNRCNEVSSSDDDDF